MVSFFLKIIDFITKIIIFLTKKEEFVINNGVLFNYFGHETHVVIPDGVTEIYSWAFEYRENVESIKMPNSVKIIDACAFCDCANLKSIEIPNSVTEIYNGAFQRCRSLTNIEIPSSVTRIGSCAFDKIAQVQPQYNANGSLRAFKAFDKDWTCRRFQYAVGKSFHQDGEIECCEKGFHACTNPLAVFNYYDGNLNNLRFAEVELSGKMDWYGNKVAASDIKIVRELTVSDLADIYNSMEKA